MSEIPIRGMEDDAVGMSTDGIIGGEDDGWVPPAAILHSDSFSFTDVNAVRQELRQYWNENMLFAGAESARNILKYYFSESATFADGYSIRNVKKSYLLDNWSMTSAETNRLVEAYGMIDSLIFGDDNNSIRSSLSIRQLENMDFIGDDKVRVINTIRQLENLYLTPQDKVRLYNSIRRMELWSLAGLNETASAKVRPALNILEQLYFTDQNETRLSLKVVLKDFFTFVDGNTIKMVLKIFLKDVFSFVDVNTAKKVLSVIFLDNLMFQSVNRFYQVASIRMRDYWTFADLFRKVRRAISRALDRLAKPPATIYMTIEGDRWDRISEKYYGHPDHYQEIIKANPELSDEVKQSLLLPANISLVIPDVTIKPKYPDNLPWWKKR